MPLRHRVIFALALLALGPLAFLGRPANAQPIEILTLRYRHAQDVLPLLRPFIEPGGALTGQGNQLFIRTSEANRRQIEQMLVQLDRAPRQLLITVRQDRIQDSTDQQVGAQGSVTYHSTRSVTGRGTLNVRDEHTVGTRNLVQTLRVLEGARATLTMGVAVPFTFRRWLPQPDGGWIDTSQTVYYDALSGFDVRPTLNGDSVTLEITPQESTLSSGGVESMRVATQVQVRLGEWVALGGADLRAEQSTRGLLSQDASAQSGQRGVWVKVERAE